MWISLKIKSLKIILPFCLVVLFFVFAPKAFASTLYWYGGDGNWSAATGHWSTNSGNSPVADHIAPVAADTVVTDTLSNATAYTITIDGAAVCAGATFGPPLSGNLTITTSAITGGSGGGTALTGCSGITFTTPATQYFYKASGNVKATEDQDLVAQWQKFTNSKTEVQAQIEVKNLLGILAERIKVQ